MRIPRTLWVGGEQFKVSRRKPSFLKNEYFGYCDLSTKTIYINPRSSPKKVAMTILHEVTHAFLQSFDEKLVEQIEEGLSDFLQHNPTVGRAIIRALRG